MFNPVPKPQHKRRAPKQSYRNTFDHETAQKILQDHNFKCVPCKGIAMQIHHVMPRSRQGRGVYSNGLPVCDTCHVEIHQNNELLNKWIEIYTEKYGEDFYKDRWDK